MIGICVMADDSKVIWAVEPEREFAMFRQKKYNNYQLEVGLEMTNVPGCEMFLLIGCLVDLNPKTGKPERITHPTEHIVISPKDGMYKVEIDSFDDEIRSSMLAAITEQMQPGDFDLITA